MIWITAAEIDNWTSQEPRRAQEILPLLIEKLVLAFCKDIIDYHFPYGKAVQYNGYDGYLETKVKSPFIPEGVSVWEIGTDKNIRKKFNDDYKKRTEEPNGFIQAETTFCFATSRIWNHKQGIAEITEEKNQQRIWKRVIIIDANNLEQMLENSPSVQVWFSSIMGKPMEGVQDVSSFWKNIIKTTMPQLNTDFFLYNKKSIVAEIAKIMDLKARQIVIVSSSWLETVLCIVAEVVSSEDKSVKAFGERCLLVSSFEAMKRVDAKCDNLIIIPCFYFTEQLPTLCRNLILIPVNQFDPIDRINNSGNRIVVPARTRHEFCEALTKLGFDSSDSYSMGNSLRCNFMALYRQICTNTLIKVPSWSKQSDVSVLLPALFAGAWEENKSGDKSIIAQLSEKPYGDYTTSIIKYTVGENMTLSLTDRTYACISIEEMWDCLWDQITEKEFLLFKQCFVKVFSESDPTYDLPEEKWYLAGILEKEPSFPRELKEGMIVSLIMMVTRKDPQRYRQFTEHIEIECSELVKGVFDNLDSLQQWQTICPYLSLLFEAAPDIVLKALEKEADSDQSVFWKLFKSSEDALFGRSFYTHILWTLEEAVWMRRYATRALNLLISYAKKGFSYKLSNSPEESLFQIFCIWMPQGVFTFDERKALLQNIITNHHKIAPALFKKLLSIGTQTTSDISKPRWRTIEAPCETVTVAQVSEMRKFLTHCYLDCITPCFDDWHFVFSELRGFENIIDVSEKCLKQKERFSENDRLEICNDLLDYISQSRKFNRDELERVDIVEKLYYELLPNTPKSYAHFFAYHFDGLNPIPFDSDDYDFKMERESLNLFRKEKFQEMVHLFGPESAVEIIPLIEDISAYADAIWDVIMQKEIDWNNIFFLKTINETVAAKIVVAAYYYRSSFMEKAKFELESENLGWVLSCLPMNPKITRIVNETDSARCKQVYWENVSILGIDTSDTSWINEVIHSMLHYLRPYSVVDYFAYADWNEPKTIIEVLETALSQQPLPEPSGLTLIDVGSNDIQRMFEKLYKNATGLEMRIAQLELSFLNAFDLEFEPKCLISLILESPAVYFELLTFAYLSDDGFSKSKSKNRKHFAEVAFSALHKICRIPGYSVESETIDENKFNHWVDATTFLASNNKYKEAHDIVLGQILSYSPNGTDGIWPAECVRHVFEKSHSDSLENNFIIGKTNQRGVYTVTAGKEEEKIAAQYKMQADKLQIMYPLTAAILLRISDNYYYQAECERARELRGI